MKETMRVIGLTFLAVGYCIAGQTQTTGEIPDATLTNEALNPSSSVSWATGLIRGAANRHVVEVHEGQSIQKAVAAAQPGDLVRVFPGTYKETVYIDKDDIYLQGVVEKSRWPVLEGEKQRNDAFLYSGNNIVIDHFRIANFKGNGVMGQAGNNFIIRYTVIEDAGVYGIFPQFGKNGLIEYNILSGIEDAAIYVGMCDNIDVRFNYVFANVAGIEIENSRHALVEGNYAYDNTGGILAFITPGLPIKTAYDIIIRDNFVFENNRPNFGIPGSIVANLPAGTGMVIMAADDVIIENNIIRNNNNVGIVVTDFSFGANQANDPDSEPNPDRVTILDNFMINNGAKPVKELAALLAFANVKDGIDILSVGEGKDSTIRNRERYNTLGLEKFGEAEIGNTAHIVTAMLDEPVPSRAIASKDKAKYVYYGVCSGCHAYNVRMIGPATITIQALYQNNPQGIAEYIASPVRKRSDYPEMPPQAYIAEDVRLEVAKFMLDLKK